MTRDQLMDWLQYYLIPLLAGALVVTGFVGGLSTSSRPHLAGLSIAIGAMVLVGWHTFSDHERRRF